MGYNCWICKDCGMVAYNKVKMVITYDMAVRCFCKAGKRKGSKISTVSETMAMKVAEDNYLEYIICKSKGYYFGVSYEVRASTF